MENHVRHDIELHRRGGLGVCVGEREPKFEDGVGVIALVHKENGVPDLCSNKNSLHNFLIAGFADHECLWRGDDIHAERTVVFVL